MKRFLLSLILGLVVTISALQAQQVNVNINIGSQPAWGPIGYDYVDYYYMPDINCYYSVNQGLFFYFNAGHWVGVPYLPPYYRNYDFNTMYKVVLVGHDPWRHNKRHCQVYAQYRGRPSQPIIRYSNDKRYYNSRRNDAWWYDRRDNQRYDRRDNNRYNNGRSSSASHSQAYSNGRSSNNEYRPQNQRRDIQNSGRLSSSDNRSNRQINNDRKNERRSTSSNMSNRSSGSYYVQTSSKESTNRSNKSSDSGSRTSNRTNRR